MPRFDSRTSAAPDGGTHVLHVTGEVDRLSLAAFEATLADVVGVARRCVDVDLGEVTFLGCPGITALLEARSAAADRGVALRVVTPSEPVARVLRLAGLDESLSTHPRMPADAGS